MIVDHVLHLNDLGEVMLWFRGLVPSPETLVVVSGPGERVEIPPDMTLASFVQAIQ